MVPKKVEILQLRRIEIETEILNILLQTCIYILLCINMKLISQHDIIF